MENNARQIWERICLVIIFFITIASFIIFFSTLSKALRPGAEQEIPVQLSAGQSASLSTSVSAKNIPEYISIPSISVSASVEQVGINTKGNISAPSSFSTVGWYKYGPVPGDMGIALIDGHVNNGLNLAGIFINLDKIQKGDDIYVTNGNGKKTHFVVSSISYLDYTDHLDSIVSGQSQEPELALITCSGDWIPSMKTYNKRMLVIAKVI